MPETESNTGHVHEWSAGSGNGYSYENGAFCLPCRAYIDWDFQEVVRRYQAHDALVAALEGLLPLLNEFEGQSYGIFLGGDPRDFSPDTECCTPEEIARWVQACAEWEAGVGTDRGPGCATFGDASAWTGSGFGVGTTTRIQPEMEQARAALRLAKGEAS